jgi:hypothetical protein
MKDNMATRRTIQPWRDSPIQLLFQDQDTSFLSYPSFLLSSLPVQPVTNALDRLQGRSKVTSRPVYGFELKTDGLTSLIWVVLGIDICVFAYVLV